MKKEKEIRLTELEIKIMRVLWENDRYLTIQEIGKHLEEEGISTASVAQSMKYLIKKKAVFVSGRVLVASVYARTFCPCFSKEEFLAMEFGRLQRCVLGTKKLNLRGLVTALLNSADQKISAEEIEKLQQIVEERKKEI